MSFEVPADAYGRFMGRYAEPLATPFADFAGVEAGATVVDVGCGPGALTSVLLARLGPGHVAAVDPSAPFVEAVAARCPGADVHAGSAERLPFADAAFDAAVAQLVVQFMSEPVRGLREMARVTAPGGTVAACVWDHAGGRGPLSPFWRVVRIIDPAAPGESAPAGVREGHLAALFEEAGIDEVDAGELTVTVTHESFEEWWEPYTFGVGPAGDYVRALEDPARERLRAACRDSLPTPPFEVSATAWAVRGVRRWDQARATRSR